MTVKVKMFSDYNCHSESEFYYPDELNFRENEPVSASTSHNNLKNVNKCGEITRDIKKINKLPFWVVRTGKIFCSIR